VPAAETVHVGNHFEHDVRGALNAGMRAVWIDRAAEGLGDREGVPVVPDLRGLLELLGAGATARA
jgi:FMN phosphatase YigB (HAD superfamily)